MKPEDRTILLKAIQKYGSKAQIEMLIEECSEVIQAVQKRKRLLDGDTHTENYQDALNSVNNNLFEELADLSIMLDQMMIIFPEPKIASYKKEKIERLSNRLKS